MAKKALLVVSFGSTHEDTIKDTISAAERDLALAFPDRQLYTAWTSRFIRKTMEARDRHIDSPAEAIERMELAGVTDVLVQPTLITANYEYLDLLEVLKAARGRFERIACGTPVITDEKDAADLAAALKEHKAYLETLKDKTSQKPHSTPAPTSSNQEFDLGF